MCANFQAIWTNLTFLTQIWSKIDFWSEIQEKKVEIRITILEIPCEPIFRQNGQL